MALIGRWLISVSLVKKFTALRLSNYFKSLPVGFYSQLTPHTLDDPRLVAVSTGLANELGIDPTSLDSPEALSILSGGSLLSGSEPLAMKYTGHQFGYYNPDLGDGRGLLLGELTDHNNLTWDFHLKGTGKTPYSRQGDGRAVLRSSIREFLCSEAMYGLGIPTTRALSVVSCQNKVFREQVETAATVLRVTPSHIRFGHFEYAFHIGGIEKLKAMCDYTLKQYYPCVVGSSKQYEDLFVLTAEKTASLIAKWQAFGFAHGVMNTDNMSILGETFDYGPFGFMESFDSGYICNHSDTEGRYAFDRQPAVAHWNLSVLAHAMSPLLEQDVLAEGLKRYGEVFDRDYMNLMSAKLGLEPGGDNQELVVKTLNMLAENKLDYSYFFRKISDVGQGETEALLRDLCVNRQGFDQWLSDYKEKTDFTTEEHRTQRKLNMDLVNPKYILRNYLAQQAIDLAQTGDYSLVRTLYAVLQRPFDEQVEHSAFAELPPGWAEQIEVSCSS